MIPWVTAAWALWLGVLTSISPCPLATNIAAISFLGRRVGSPRAVLLSGLLYTAGQVVAYAGLGAALVAGLSARSEMREFLRAYVSRFLGPVLILAGMAVLGLLGSGLSFSLAGMRTQERSRRGGAIWAAMLGFLLALSFCPGTAAIFFGGLLPLAASQGSWFLLPALYGLGAALPVAATAGVLSLGSRAIGKTFERVRVIEKWARVVTGVIFIAVGVYYSLTYIFGVWLSVR